ncbi:Kynurenine 3-monooxygenase [Acaryochloris thomasi RCC1774]|uniref:Kynurenine 3-monooxygenase n=1 Tax=Acaryochloris thomasi RCC1774 TaxID=1764569 RepID=A0A2W1JGL7_9CYAN|nr:NAD(P)/FAD-dependent oxidoreductase [Acaryochloris thomasi]PZD72743.1 Kynurenine 3-monooxygenase [Acaryochloris thomasi RCC1774]
MIRSDAIANPANDRQIHQQYDVVVIGGGPAGSTLAMLLVRQGYQVLLLERAQFPRFHVGESLLPASQLIWEKLGITDQLQDLNFTYKDSAEFRLGLDPRSSDYESAYVDFTAPQNWPQKDFPEHPDAYQVKRSEFDWFLLQQARSQGVTVCEQATVKEVLWEGDRATGICWRSKTGQNYTTMANCVADCSGRQALIGRSRKLIKTDPFLQTSAVFGHFRNVTPNPGREGGAIAMYFIERGWLWFIPVGPNEMSVGVVVNRPDDWQGRSPEEILMTYINRHQYLRDRFINAEQISKVRILQKLAYSAKRKAGDGWILVGDASFFVDPFLSSGVQVAFKTADKAADAIHTFLQSQRNQRSFHQYQHWCRQYEFHVFVTMRLLYWIMESQSAMQTFIQAIGYRLQNRPDPIVRRFVAWSLGYFDRFHGALYCLWLGFSLMAGVGWLRRHLFRRPDWSHPSEFCDQPSIDIPKSIAPQNQAQNSFAKPLG